MPRSPEGQGNSEPFSLAAYRILRDFLASVAVNSRETTWLECKVLRQDLENGS